MRANAAPGISGRGGSARWRWTRTISPPPIVTSSKTPCAQNLSRAQDWPWSSARALLGLGEDPLTDTTPARQRFARFADLLDGPEDPEAVDRLRKGESVGRPAGSDDFLASLEARLGRRLRPLPRGPKPKDAARGNAAHRGEVDDE